MLSCWVKTCRQFSRVFSKISNNGNVASCPFTTFVEENLVLIHNEHPARGCSRHGLHSCTTKVVNLLSENVRMFSKVNTQLQCYEGAVHKAIRRHPRASWAAHNRQFVAIRTDHRWLFNCLQKTLISNLSLYVIDTHIIIRTLLSSMPRYFYFASERSRTSREIPICPDFDYLCNPSNCPNSSNCFYRRAKPAHLTSRLHQKKLGSIRNHGIVSTTESLRQENHMQRKH